MNRSARVLSDEELEYLTPYSFKKEGGRLPRKRSTHPRIPNARMEHGIEVKDGDKFRLEFESVKSDWGQGVSLAADKGIEIKGKLLGPRVQIWQETAPGGVEFACRTKDGMLWVWNAWQAASPSGVRTMLSRTNYCGMLIEELPDGYRFRCNEGRDDDDYDDLIFTLRRIDGTSPRADAKFMERPRDKVDTSLLETHEEAWMTSDLSELIVAREKGAITKKVIKEILEAVGDGTGATDRDLKNVIRLFYLHDEKVEPADVRAFADLIDSRSGRVKEDLAKAITHAEWLDLEDIIYRWQEEQKNRVEYRAAVEEFEVAKARGLNIPVSKAMLAIAVTVNVDARRESDVEYIVKTVISKYPGPPKESAFKKWLRENWKELNPYPRIGRKQPHWIQEPEWPTDEEGKPLTFVGQLDIRGSKVLPEDTSYYVFQNMKTGEAVVVAQMY